MVAAQTYITALTPLGANLVADGATFSLWAPGAQHVYLAGDPSGGYVPVADDELVLDPTTGRWTGFFPGVKAGAKYRFQVVGAGGTGLKRDPWARELGPGYPDCDCIVVDPAGYRWHDGDYRSPAPDELIVAQLHMGAYYARDPHGVDLRPVRAGGFLDAVNRIEYLADLGVTAVQPLPVAEFHGEWSLGYNGTDLFSPERDYCIPEAQLAPYLASVNSLLSAKGFAALTIDQLIGQVTQLKIFVDLCHVYGIAVLFDVVYNHAGGDLDAQSLDHIDLPARPDAVNSVYFSGAGWAGGRIFDFANPGVQDFLIGNAEMYLAEFHADGLRFDEVTVIDANGGWSFCQRMTAELHANHPTAILIAEYWGEQRWRATTPSPAGMGFDIGYADGLRDAVRTMVQAAEGGASASVDIDALNQVLRPPGVAACWQAYNCLENQDLVLDADGDHRHPRIARLADMVDSRSWYARSRARVAMATLLTAPGSPMIFMGQEFLEDKLWSDDSHLTKNLIWWDGLDGADQAMADFHRCTRALIALRRRYPALRADPITIHPADQLNRVAVFRRWFDGAGGDVMVVISLSETTFYQQSYAIGMPEPGHWQEVFNSDLYDRYPNPVLQGNPAGVQADGPPLHGMAQSAQITLPANSVLVFSR